jgi:hypothetical protein
MIRIKQLKRSYSRRLKSVMQIFTSVTSSLDMLIMLLISLSKPERLLAVALTLIETSFFVIPARRAVPVEGY